LSGRGLCDELITRPEESYLLCCVVVCDLETSRMGAPYIYDISHLRVNINTDLLASYKAAGHRLRYFGRLQLEHKAVTHCSRDEHLARPYIDKRNRRRLYSSHAWSAYGETEVQTNRIIYRKARTQHDEISL